MAGDYNDFPCPESVQARLSLIGEIEATWELHPDELAIAINGSMEVLRILAGKMPPAEDPESRFFSDVLVTLVNLDSSSAALHQVVVQGYHTTRMDCDLRPSKEALASLDRRQAAYDHVTEPLVAHAIYSRELSDTALKLILEQPRQLGPRFVSRMNDFASVETNSIPIAPVIGRPRILTRRRRT